jgi:hypothetical protein
MRPFFLLVSPAERDDFAFCALLFFVLFTASRELFYFFCAPFLSLRLHSKRALFFVVILELFFVFIPPPFAFCFFGF